VSEGAQTVPERLKNFQEMRETPTYNRPMELIRQRIEGSGGGYPNAGSIFTIFQ